MTSTLLTVAGLLLSAPLPVPEAPKGPPPRILVVEVENDGPPFIVTPVIEFKKVPTTVTVVVGGKTENRTEVRTVQVEYRIKVGLNDKDCQVFGLDGKRLAPEEVQKRITRSSPILVSSDGKPVDPFYLKLAREGTVVVVSPKLVAPANQPMPRTPELPIPPKD